jgi:hypothetical protein
MNAVILKQIGIYLLAVLEALLGLLTVWIGWLIDGIRPEIAVAFATIIGATEILLIFMISYIFKVKVDKVD